MADHTGSHIHWPLTLCLNFARHARPTLPKAYTALWSTNNEILKIAMRQGEEERTEGCCTLSLSFSAPNLPLRPFAIYPLYCGHTSFTQEKKRAHPVPPVPAGATTLSMRATPSYVSVCACGRGETRPVSPCPSSSQSSRLPLSLSRCFCNFFVNNFFLE